MFEISPINLERERGVLDGDAAFYDLKRSHRRLDVHSELVHDLSLLDLVACNIRGRDSNGKDQTSYHERCPRDVVRPADDAGTTFGVVDSGIQHPEEVVPKKKGFE